MKRFYLERISDVSGVSGNGRVAEGCQMSTKWCALVWLTDLASMSYYPSIETLEEIHGHSGLTKVVWLDKEETTPP